MSNRTYDLLKTLALLILPIGTFISTFFNIWGLPAAEQIQQTFIAFDVLCGAIVSIAKANYDAGGGAE